MSFNNVKLTDKEVYQILFLNKVEGLLPYEIEEKFPVSRETIRKSLMVKVAKIVIMLLLITWRNIQKK